MTIKITPEIEKAYNDYLNEPIDFDFIGSPILRKNTYPYNTEFSTGIVTFAAGYQKATNSVMNECIRACYNHTDIERFGVYPIRVAMITKACENNIREHFGLSDDN